MRCATRRLSFADIDELARLQRKIMYRSVRIDQLLARDTLQTKSDESPDATVGAFPGRNALAELLDDITEAAHEMAAIVNRDDTGGAE
jgi:hypothetical protein